MDSFSPHLRSYKQHPLLYINETALYLPMDRTEGRTLKGDKDGEVYEAAIIPGVRGGALDLGRFQWVRMFKHK